MKIAVITDTFYTINGVSRTYQEMVKYCRKKRIRLDVFTLGKTKKTQKLGSVNVFQFAAKLPLKYYYDLPPFDVRIVSPGFKEKFTPHLDDSKSKNSKKTKLSSLKKQGAGFTKTKYDVIHLATPGSLGIAARIMLANDPTPKVGCFHTLVAEYVSDWTQKGLEKLPFKLKKTLPELSQSMIWGLLKWFYSRTDLVLAPSKTTAKKLKILQKPIKIFPRGVDTKIFNPTHKNPKLKSSLPIALYVGRLSLEKNLDLLVKVFKNRTNCQLWLAGDGPYKKGLKAQLPKAKFFGYLTGQKLSEVYAGADFFVFPSTTDTFGNVVLEAQASGLPCIVTNIGGPQELIKNKINGLICKPTAKDFNNAIDYLIKNKNQRKKMGQKARNEAVKKTWPKVFTQLFRIYKKIA